MRNSARPRANAAHLKWRIYAFCLGAALGLAGIYLEISWLVTVALIVLLGGVLLRVLALRSPDGDAQEPVTPEG